MLCQSCRKDKQKSEMNRRKRYCRICWKKIRQKRYVKKHKKQITAYYKQWYEETGKDMRKIKHYPQRNKRFYEMYLHRKEKHFSVEAIAKMFQISPSEAYEIIKTEEKVRKQENASGDKN